MPYIIRDATGNIAAVYNQSVQGGEEVASDDADLQAFIQATVSSDQDSSVEWVQSDMDLARVMEDLIDILFEKNLINLMDFPEGAQRKLLGRRRMRKELVYIASLFEGVEGDDSDGGGFL